MKGFCQDLDEKIIMTVSSSTPEVNLLLTHGHEC